MNTLKYIIVIITNKTRNLSTGHECPRYSTFVTNFKFFGKTDRWRRTNLNAPHLLQQAPSQNFYKLISKVNTTSGPNLKAKL